jgi:ABC-2 type transport system ATP-binding protein
MTSIAIDVQDLTKVYRRGRQAATALNAVSFSVGAGETFGFLGPNGSGKTTTVRILVTLLAQTSGAARVAGFDTARASGAVRRMIGYAGQFIGVDEDLTVHENLVLQGLLHGVPLGTVAARRGARAHVGELLDAFGLDEVADQRAGRLSGGMRRRLDLAQALVHRPAVVFLDEPTTGLDPQSRNALWEYLRRPAGDGITIFLTTQYLAEADRACDRVAILDGGRLIKTGTPDALKIEIGAGRLVLTLASDDSRERAAAVLAGCPGVVRVEPGDAGDRLVLHVHDVGGSVAPVIVRLHDRPDPRRVGGPDARVPGSHSPDRA